VRHESRSMGYVLKASDCEEKRQIQLALSMPRSRRVRTSLKRYLEMRRNAKPLRGAAFNAKQQSIVQAGRGSRK
jgi:hypothetical protein